MDYRDYVESLAKNGEDKIFFNSGPIHAAIVMSRIFKYSNRLIKIYCGGFNGAVSNDPAYLRNLQDFFHKGGQLKVLVEEDLSENSSSEIFKVLRKHAPNVEIYKANNHVINSETRTPIHFTIGDEKMLRFETGTSDYTAQVNFGDTDRANVFSDLFEKIWNQSKNNKILLA